MKDLRRLVPLVALPVAFVVSAPAAELEGILMDKACSAKFAKEGQKGAKMHTRECALMPPCAESGYGVYTSDNKYITFDAAGNEKTKKALEASDKKDNLVVKVTGKRSGDTIQVKTLKLL